MFTGDSLPPRVGAFVGAPCRLFPHRFGRQPQTRPGAVGVGAQPTDLAHGAVGQVVRENAIAAGMGPADAGVRVPHVDKVMTFRVVVIPDVVEKGDVQKVRHLEAVDEIIAEGDRMRRLLVELAARRPHGEGAGGDPHQLVYCGGDGRVRAGQLKRVRHPGSRAGTAARNAAPPWGRASISTRDRRRAWRIP